MVDDFLWGSNLIIRKTALESIGGFDPERGMIANKIAYGAETHVQKKLREKGIKIYYDPELIIYHAVGPQKLHLSWHLKATYATARDGKAYFGRSYTARSILRLIYHSVRTPMISTSKLLIRKKYYWENWILDCLKGPSHLLGTLVALYRDNRKN